MIPFFIPIIHAAIVTTKAVAGAITPMLVAIGCGESKEGEKEMETNPIASRAQRVAASKHLVKAEMRERMAKRARKEKRQSRGNNNKKNLQQAHHC